MSDALDDWEQADELEIRAPVVAPAPVKKITLLSRPSTGSLSPTGPSAHTTSGVSPGGGGGGIGRPGGGGGAPMILKRNPGSNNSGGSASQHGPSPTGQGSPTPPFGRESSAFGDNTYSNSNSNSNSSSGRRSGAGYREEDPDLVGGDTLRRQMDGMSLRERNRTLWDQANAYEQPVIARADTTRTEYVPEIRILRRPKSPVQSARVSNQVKSKPLAQREADYNAAREKIFGPSPTPTSPSSSSPNNNNNNNDTTTLTTGSRGSGSSPRRNSPSVGGGSSSPNSRPSSRPSSRSVSPSQPHQPVQIYSGSSSGAFETALENVKPVEFRGGPPPSRRGGNNSGGRGTVQENVNTAIRQPMGPTSASSGQSGGSKPRGRGRGRGGSGGSGSGMRSPAGGSEVGSSRQEAGSIGFRRPMGRGGSGSTQPRPPPA